jgi:XrtJ-associated TM-motif-TM protein
MMKSICKILFVLTLVLVAMPLHAQRGCEDSPEDPTVVLALVGTAGVLLGVAQSRWAARRRK